MKSASGRSRSEFWRFSLGFYRGPGVAAACLLLQERCGVDVNVLFYLLFLADRRRCANKADIARMDAAAAPWRAQTVESLRALRRLLKEGLPPFDAMEVDALRKGIKRLELDAEWIEQEALERLFPEAGFTAAEGSRVGAALFNLDAYGDFLDRPLLQGQLDILIESFAGNDLQELYQLRRGLCAL